MAFDYLGDPRNRPEWQSSLLSVTLVDRDDEPHLGMTWRETTMVGVRPRMEITGSSGPRCGPSAAPGTASRRRWCWPSTSATARCRVVADGEISGRGVYAAPAAVAGRLAGLAIGADLRKAARILERRA